MSTKRERILHGRVFERNSRRNADRKRSIDAQRVEISRMIQNRKKKEPYASSMRSWLLYRRQISRQFGNKRGWNGRESNKEWRQNVSKEGRPRAHASCLRSTLRVKRHHPSFFAYTTEPRSKRRRKKTKTFLFAQTYLSQCSGCNPYESFLILAVILSNATSTRRPSLLITCMFSIMLCYGHQSYEDCCSGMIRLLYIREKKKPKKEEERRFFAFFSFSSSSSSHAVKNTTHVCLLF